MDCNEARRCLAAHLDDELDVVRDAEVVAHLDACPACSEIALAHAARRGLVRDKLPRFSAPPDLVTAVRAQIRREDRTASIAPPAWRLNRGLGLAAALAVTGLAGYFWGVRQTRAQVLADELASSHVRALMTGHAVEVASTDRHTVKPWFAGRLDFAPAVNDLAGDGFPLIGGRLDRVGGRTVAVLVYQRRQHFIDLYVWPADGGATPGDTTRAGFNVIGWSQAGEQHFAVSDLAGEELAEFARLQRAVARRDR
jgi:anti-sigma factor RsiW